MSSHAQVHFCALSLKSRVNEHLAERVFAGFVAAGRYPYADYRGEGGCEFFDDAQDLRDLL